MNVKQVRLYPEYFTQGIFSAMDESDWRSVGLPPPELLARRGVLYRANDAAHEVILLCTGLVKTFRSPTEQRVQIINIHGPGDLVGVEALTRSEYRETASALARTVAIRVPRDEFLRLMRDRPEVSITLVKMMNEESERIRSLIVDLGTKKAMPRVASCILLFMRKQGPPVRREPFNLPISRQEMGAFLGLSPETVSRQLRGLVDSRVIRIEHRRLTVLDTHRLEHIAGA